MSNTVDYVVFFRENERTICNLHARVHETLKSRGTSKGRVIWSEACSEFHARYDGLAFPGGYESGLSRVREDDAQAVEAALVFLELRPYFFRSGYMRETLMRRLKHVTLSVGQQARFAAVLESQRQWRTKAQQGIQADRPEKAGPAA